MEESITYKAAIRRALIEEMQANPKTMLTGQDVGSFSALGVSNGFLDMFGAERIRDCPISESAMVGMAVGAAMKGWTSVVELAYADISAVAFGSIVHSAAKLHYATGGQLRCPVIVHAPIGRWSRHGPMGTEVTASWYCNVPELAICMPSCPAEAYWGMRAAFHRTGPTLYLDDRSLFDIEGPVGPAIDVEKARVVREGNDLAIVAAGRALHIARQAADTLATCGIDVELLGLGSVKPFDRAAVKRCAARTGKVLVVQDEPPHGGYGPMAMAVLAALPPGVMKAAARMVCREDTFLRHIREEDQLPTPADIVAAAKAMAGAE